MGPVIANASPATAVSWADAGPSGDVELLPVHDSIDEREALLQHGKRLEALLESEAVLHMERKAKRE